MKFGDYLRQLRMQHGWTQPEAAARVGIEQSYLSKLETGKSVPSGEIYDRLAGAYGIAPSEILDVLFPEELERLREIDSLRTLMLAQTSRRRAAPRRWLVAVLAMLVEHRERPPSRPSIERPRLRQNPVFHPSRPEACPRPASSFFLNAYC